MDAIEPIPVLPSGVKDALDMKRLVVFVGAGVSRVVGCTGWDDLAKDLVSACFEKRYINFKEKEKLSGEPDHRKTISICYHIIKEIHNDPELFYEYLQSALKAKAGPVGQSPANDIYGELYRLRAVFVTTNADEIFDGLFNRSAVVYKPQDIPDKALDPTKLYHLHGTIRDRASLVFRVDEYITHYRKEQVQAFLQRLFSDYTILFVGYGLAELQLLEYVIMNNRKDDGSVRHFYLLPMYKGEENLLEFEKAYFRRLGIEVVAYDITADGYGQLYNVMKAWQTELNRTSLFLASTFEFIESVAADYDPAIAERVLQLIRNDPPVADHFFKRASDPRWLIPLRDAGHFDPAKNPTPRGVPDKGGTFTLYWSPLTYLEKVAARIAPDDGSTFTSLMEIVRGIVDYKDRDGKRIENYLTDWAITKIYAIVPDGVLELKDIDRVLLFLQSQSRTPVDSEVCVSLLPHLLRAKNKELTLALYDTIISWRWETRVGREEPIPLVDEYWLSETLKRHLSTITDLIASEAAQSTVGVMRAILKRDARAFHIISIPALDLLERYELPDRYEGILVAAARDSIVAGVVQSPEEGRTIVRDLLQDSHPIFRRLGLNTVAEQWPILKDEFWSFASRSLPADRFVAPELRALVRKNFASFEEGQKKGWVEWIDSAPYWTPEEVKQDSEHEGRYLARLKLRQLSGIRGKGYSPADALYERYAKVVGAEVGEEDDVIWSGPVSVVTAEESVSSKLLEMSIPEMVQFLTSQPQEQALWHRRDIEGSLNRAAETTPEKFIAGIAAFHVVSADHKAALIRGLVDARKAGRTYDWAPLLGFCRKLTSVESFWTGEPHPQLEEDVAEVIIVGTTTEGDSLEAELLPEAEAIILTMLAHTRTSVVDESRAVSETVNSPKGRVLLAAITYSLRVARLKKDKAVSPGWPPAIREEFSRRLDRQYDDSLEFSVSLGQYLIYLHSLDKVWLEQHIDEVFPKGSERHWRAAFGGYLAHGTVYSELYDLLRKRNHYRKALTAEFEPWVRKRLVDHICFGYLRDAERLDDPTSMIRSLIGAWDVESVRDIIMFFWIRRKDSQPPDSSKALAVWKLVSEHYEQKLDLTTEEKVTVSRLAMMSVHLDSIDERALRWLKLTAKYVDRGHDTATLVENLDRLADTSPRDAGLVLLEMLNNDIYPDYDSKHIISAVEKIYKAGEKTIGNSISNLYLARGHEFLRSVFRQHNA